MTQRSVQCFASPGSLQERAASNERTGSFGEAYQLGELLGQGSFGSVYRAVSRTDPGTGYAVKMVPKHREGVLDERIARRIHEEVCWHCHVQGQVSDVKKTSCDTCVTAACIHAGGGAQTAAVEARGSAVGRSV